MVIDVDMLCTRMVDVVFSNVDGGGIIASQGSRRELQLKSFAQNVRKPNSFFTGKGEGNVFGLSGRERDEFLSLRGPGNWRAEKAKDIP